MLALVGGLWKKAELIWSGLAKPVMGSGLVWPSHTLMIWIQEEVWSSGLLEKIGSICGKEKEK